MPDGGLTWNGNGKLLGLRGQKPPAQLVGPAVGWTNQSDGALAVSRLVVEGHFLVGQVVIRVWRHSSGGVSETSPTQKLNHFELLSRSLPVTPNCQRETKS